MAYNYNREKLIKILQEFNKTHGKISLSLFDAEKNIPSSSFFIKEFGSWVLALEAANIPLNNNMTKEEVIILLQTYYQTHGKITTSIVNKDRIFPSMTYIRNLFGSWPAALEAANIPLNNQMTKEEAIIHLQNFYNKYGKITYTLVEQDKTMPSINVFRRLFKTFKNALIAAKLCNQSELSLQKEEVYTKEELINYLKDFHNEYGTISKSLFENDKKYPSTSTYIKYFGSWEHALKEANFPTYELYTEEELINYLKDFYNKNGTITIPLFQEDLNNPSLTTYARIFGSWRKALIAADLPVYTYTEAELHQYINYRSACKFYFSKNFDLSKIKGYDLFLKLGKYNHKLNPNGVVKDHMYSVKQGFLNNVSYKIMNHPANCEFITNIDNLRKRAKCSITFNELLTRISDFKDLE